MSIEVMKQALAALETCDLDYDYEENPYTTYDEEAVYEAITALRQAIREAALQKLSDGLMRWSEQAEKQEPVAYRYRVMSGVSSGPCWTFTLPQPEAILETQPLYAAPPKAEKQEPVAWADQYDLERDWHDFLVSRQKTVKDTIPLYTAPPKREWQGLTDEEIFDVIRPFCKDDEAAEMLIHVSMDEYRAIEAKIKEKNK